MRVVNVEVGGHRPAGQPGAGLKPGGLPPEGGRQGRARRILQRGARRPGDRPRRGGPSRRSRACRAWRRAARWAPATWCSSTTSSRSARAATRCCASLKDQLSRLGPEDRMAIVAYDGGGVEMLSSWSNSERQLGAAIEKAIGEPAHGLARLAELRSFETLAAPHRRAGLRARAPRPSFAQRLDIEEIEFAAAPGRARPSGRSPRRCSTLRGFASPPGRKVMLLLSGGWPFSPVDYVVNNPNRPVLDRDVPRGDEILRPLADTANRLGYTIYPVDVPGVESARRPTPRSRGRRRRASTSASRSTRPPCTTWPSRPAAGRCSTRCAARRPERSRSPTPAPTTGSASPRPGRATTSATRWRSTGRRVRASRCARGRTSSTCRARPRSR